MSESKYYSLADKKRLFKFPFKLKEVGWLPGHYFSHKNAVLEDIYVCMSCYMEDGCFEKNGKIIFSEHDYDKIYFSLLEPYTKLHTLKAAVHDELFFRFDIADAQAVRDLIGDYKSFCFFNWPIELMTELQELLHQLDTPGVADKIDQLSIRLITEIIYQHIKHNTEDCNNMRMRIFSAANELINGRPLAETIKKNGFSRRTFYREWNKNFNTSPKNYVMQKRLEKAKKILLESDLNNIEIAHRCGFDNVKYFYIWFHKNFNMTPGEYRKSLLHF